MWCIQMIIKSSKMRLREKLDKGRKYKMRSLKIGIVIISMLLANMMIAVAMADGALDVNQEKPMIRRSPGMIVEKTRGGDGGDASTEAAVMKILWWLKATQNSDGSWGNRKKIANTSLAVLTYLSHGEGLGSWSPYHNEFETVVSSGIEYIVSRIVFDESNIKSRMGADNPRGVPQMAGRESSERPASGAARAYRLKRSEFKAKTTPETTEAGRDSLPQTAIRVIQLPNLG